MNTEMFIVDSEEEEEVFMEVLIALKDELIKQNLIYSKDGGVTWLYKNEDKAEEIDDMQYEFLLAEYLDGDGSSGKKETPITYQVVMAFEHVKRFYPDLSLVVFDLQGRWVFMDEYFRHIKFSDDFDTSLLEEALDSIQNLPLVYQPEMPNV